ncbi:MAG: CDGSH iron-sulfur domain-containing protein [Actinomycetota bacterium]
MLRRRAHAPPRRGWWRRVSFDPADDQADPVVDGPGGSDALGALLAGVQGLVDEVPETIRKRLGDSVLRPLVAAVGAEPRAVGQDGYEANRSGDTWTATLWELARSATRLRVEAGAPPSLIEAAAALQDLAASGDPARLAELRALQADVPAEIRCAADGPYLVTNADLLTNHLGVAVPTTPTMALCRCGASATKPFCDGSHVRIAFREAKDPKRVSDRRDAYDGVGITVLDNRGICQHSGLCTDRLAGVFHAGADPFVTPSGGRQDEIIRAVRACPSGALSYAIDGHEARQHVDQSNRLPTIEVSLNGPYRVTGGLALTDSQGRPESRPDGASEEHYALCRCGHSQNKPFCSGMHWFVDFHDPVPGSDAEPSIFEWAGGLPALKAVAEVFYGTYVPADPLLGPLFSEMSPDHPERVATWLAEVFGGPSLYSDGFGGYSRMISQHVGRCLTEPQRVRWVALLCRAADEVLLPADPEFRAAFVSYLEWGSRLALENSQATAQPPLNMPMPHWWWPCDATPWSRVSALARPTTEEAVPSVALPGPGEPLSFASHIKGQFRTKDRQSMRFAFDLWSHADVSAHAEAILTAVENGSMPCDGGWGAEKVEVFRRWVASGMPA